MQIFMINLDFILYIPVRTGESQCIYIYNITEIMLVLDYHTILRKVSAYSVSEVTIQAPHGLRKKAIDLAHFLENEGYSVFISADPCYGACNLKEYADLLIHLGHTPIYSGSIPVVYAHVYDDFDFVPVLQKNLEKIPHNVGILTTAQHLKQLSRVESFLTENGFNINTAQGVRTTCKGQILGCDLTAALKIKNIVTGYLYLGTGKFHPLGAAIATKKDVFKVYHTFEKVDPALLLKQRHALIFRASQSEEFGIVISTYPGQHRKKEAIDIKKYLEQKGKTAHVFIADEITPENLFSCDAYVICACPRIALDDAARFEKPVLTCTEVPLMFEQKEYTLDMIV